MFKKVEDGWEGGREGKDFKNLLLSECELKRLVDLRAQHLAHKEPSLLTF